MAEAETLTEAQETQDCPQMDSAGAFVMGWLTFVPAFVLIGSTTIPSGEPSFPMIMAQLMIAGLIGGMIFKSVAMCVNVLARAIYFRKDT